jgi:hypothetical protein
MPAMTSQFRTTSPQDAPVVAAFLQRIFDIDPSLPLIAPRHLHWKCWEQRSDWAGSRSYVITKESAIVAHITIVPLSCVGGHQRLKMIHPIDWAADPMSFGSGSILLMQVAERVDAVVVMGGSEMAQKALVALGFKTCGEVMRFVRPLRPLRRLAGQKPSLRLGAQFARSLLWSLQAPSVRTQGWIASRVAPEQLISQSIPWPRSGEEAVIFERNPDTIAYFLKCPAMPMELYAVAKEDGSCRGYFLLAHAPGQTRIVDFYVDSEGREVWRALIELAVLQAKRNRTSAEVVSLGSDTVTRQALLDCGFHARGSFALRLLPAKGVELPAGPIRFQMIDNDAAYWHANKNDYWA